jgi:hypothetical protein
MAGNNLFLQTRVLKFEETLPLDIQVGDEPGHAAVI